MKYIKHVNEYYSSSLYKVISAREYIEILHGESIYNWNGKRSLYNTLPSMVEEFKKSEIDYIKKNFRVQYFKNIEGDSYQIKKEPNSAFGVVISGPVNRKFDTSRLSIPREYVDSYERKTDPIYFEDFPVEIIKIKDDYFIVVLKQLWGLTLNDLTLDYFIGIGRSPLNLIIPIYLCDTLEGLDLLFKEANFYKNFKK